MNHYWCKCGVAFEKSTNSATTGRKLLFYNKEHDCFGCPFVKELTEGWGENAKVAGHECRSSLKETNYTTALSTTLEHTDTIRIYTLDLDFIDTVKEFCKVADEGYAGIAQTTDEDEGRCAFSISVTANKKGKAFKKKMVDTFFPFTEVIKEPYPRTVYRRSYNGEPLPVEQEKKIVLEHIEFCKTVAKLPQNADDKTETVNEPENPYITDSNYPHNEVGYDSEYCHCSNVPPYGGSCKHYGAGQAGGGTTSPHYSYIYCDKLHRKVLYSPAIPDSKSKEHSYLLPLDCPYSLKKRDNPSKKLNAKTDDCKGCENADTPVTTEPCKTCVQNDMHADFTPCSSYCEEEDTEIDIEPITEQAISRTLPTIEAEIHFYKGQAATAIIEVGKRLIEAKALVAHGEWCKWLDEKVAFTERTAQRMMAVAEMAKTTPVTDLPTSKVYALLSVSEDERQDFIQSEHNGKTIEEMTKRQVEKAVQEWKDKAEKAEQIANTLEVEADQLAGDKKHYIQRLGEEQSRASGLAEKLNDIEREKKRLERELEQAKEDMLKRPVIQGKGTIEVVEKAPVDYEDLQIEAQRVQSLEEQIEHLNRLLKNTSPEQFNMTIVKIEHALYLLNTNLAQYANGLSAETIAIGLSKLKDPMIIGRNTLFALLKRYDGAAT